MRVFVNVCVCARSTPPKKKHTHSKNVVGGSIRTYQSFNSLATSMAISEANSLLSVETAPDGNDATDRKTTSSAAGAAAIAIADDEDDDQQSVRSAEMTRL